MPHTPVSSNDNLSRDALALLAALAAEAAYGIEDHDRGQSRLAVAAARRGVSVRVASFPLAAAQAVEAAGLARWDVGEASGRRRLVIACEGRARLARRSAPAGADPFLAQHTPLVRAVARTPEAPADAAFVDAAESPLAWLATRKSRDGAPLIDAACLQAGERLRRDLTLAHMLPRVTVNWSAAGRAKGAEPTSYSDLTIAARQRVRAALDFVGDDFAGLLIDVCGFLKGVETVERERGWPRRSAKLALVLALRQLARHYGVETEAVGPSRSRGVRRWGAEDYRPAIAPDEED